jgi:hypothetical protein
MFLSNNFHPMVPASSQRRSFGKDDDSHMAAASVRSFEGELFDVEREPFRVIELGGVEEMAENFVTNHAKLLR